MNLGNKFQDWSDKVKRNTDMYVKGDTCPLIYFKKWEKSKIFAAMSTRFGGVSKNEFSSMNLSFSRGDIEEDVKENYRRISKEINTDLRKMICTVQEHTTEVKYVSRIDIENFDISNSQYKAIDGLITDDNEVTLVAYFADCVPIYIYDVDNTTIALLHAGWRGSLNNISKVALDMMSDNRKNIEVGIGPSISKRNYEVDIEVAKKFINRYEKSDIGRVVEQVSDEKYKIDLWEANIINLIESGIDAKNITVSNICTYDNNEYLFSHRYTKGKRGNLAAFMKIL